MVNLVKWPSIESFHHIRRAVDKYPHILNGESKVIYRPKVKLHGTNSAIQITKDSIYPQSRTTILNESHDNAGFAAWINSNKEAIQESTKTLQGLTIFGEWVGPGVNKGCAIHQINQKILAVFAVIDTTADADKNFLADPGELNQLLAGLLSSVSDIYILPWYGQAVEVDWALPAEELESVVDSINQEVDKVESCDPWVKNNFSIEGTGEGLVYYPISHAHLGRDMFSTLAFKAKGEKHKVVKTKKAVQLSPEQASSINEFVELTVTPARLEQGLTEVGERDPKLTGKFIGWVCQDVNKECQAELEASGLDWKNVSKAVANKARQWFLK